MKKGIGPRGLGASKSPAKMYNSPAKKNGPGKKYEKQTSYSDDIDAGEGAMLNAGLVNKRGLKELPTHRSKGENKAIYEARSNTPKSMYSDSRSRAGREASYNYRQDYKEQQKKANVGSKITGKYVYTKPKGY